MKALSYRHQNTSRLLATMTLGLLVTCLMATSLSGQERWLAQSHYGLMFHYEAFNIHSP